MNVGQKYRYQLFAAWVAMGLFVISSVKGEAPSELSLFDRCYSQLTGTQASLTHPILVQVRNGQMSALQGCLWVLDRAEILNSSGPNAGLTRGQLEPVYTLDTQDALNVLRVFYDFHATWFMHSSIRQSLQLGAFTPNNELRDEKEGAAHLSYFLHQPGLLYSDLLRGSRSVRVRRDMTPTTDLRFGDLYGTDSANYFTADYLRHNFVKPFDLTNKALVQAFPSPLGLLEIGQLRGFRGLTSDELDQTLLMGLQSNAPNSPQDPLRVNQTNLSDGGGYNHTIEVKYRRSYGGGLLGTQVYLLENLGAHNQGFFYPRADGGVRTWRRAAKAIFSDFLCRDIPTISGSDAAQFMASNPPHPFQQSPSCMSCHATTDGLAGSLRNFSLVNQTNFATPAPALGYDPYAFFATVIEHPTALTAPGQTVRKLKRDHPLTSQIAYAPQTSNFYGIDSDNTFFRQSPQGRVLMRDMNGAFINQPVTGIEELGTVLSSTDDYYMCAASRYFYFLTGFRAPNLEVPNSSPEEVQARLFVTQLGQSLKVHQSLRTLIAEILSSSYWREGIE